MCDRLCLAEEMEEEGHEVLFSFFFLKPLVFCFFLSKELPFNLAFLDARSLLLIY